MGLEQFRRPKFYVAPLAEFLGVMFLVLVACGSTEVLEQDNTVRISLCFAFSIATLVWVTAHVSGGHLNPAVSMGFLVSRKMTLISFLSYVIAQLLGAMVGAGILKVIVPDSMRTPTMGTSAPGPGVTVGQTFGIELLITFVLVWTVMATVDENRKMGGSGPLAIGLAIGMCHLWAVPLTGAGMNPARVIGPSIVSHTWKYHWAYWVGPLIGGAAAGLMYEFLFAVNATPSKAKAFFTKEYDDSHFDQRGQRVMESGEDSELHKKDYGTAA